jgi:hypothetical protein
VITTVTTATTAILSAASGASLALIAILILIGLLIQKQLVGGLQGMHAVRLNRALNVAIVPLAAVFVAIVAFKVLDLFR